MTFPCPSEVGPIACLAIKLVNGVPEDGQGTMAPGMIPHARSHHPSGLCHAPHFPQASDRIRHEVDHKLGKRRSKRRVVERQSLGRRSANVGIRIPLHCGLDERR
jgi:hypothetical protein